MQKRVKKWAVSITYIKKSFTKILQHTWVIKNNNNLSCRYADNFVEKRCNLGLDGGSFIPIPNRKIRENHLYRKMFRILFFENSWI